VKTLIAFAGSAVVALATLSAAAGAPVAQRFVPHQEPCCVGNLIVPGDRVVLTYDAPGFNSTTGTVYVRTDRRRRFTPLTLRHRSGRSSALEARVPARLIRGHELRYYAVVRDPGSGRSARVPRRGTTSARILEHPVVIRLGRHHWGHTRSGGTIVARTSADRVGWQIPPPGCGCGPSFGPETFLVGRNGSIWLDDDLNNRLLGWHAGRPDAIVRTVPLPDRSADHDVALGPNGSFYVTGAQGRGAAVRSVLYRLDSTGRVLWKSRLAGSPTESSTFILGWNSQLRTGPDGTLYVLAGMNGLPGGEFGWMPVATASGRPLARAAQRRGTHWPDQPLRGGLRLIAEAYAPQPDGPVREARYALLDRRGRLVRSWRVTSKTDINFDFTTPELVGGDPVVVLDASTSGKLEYVVLRLGPHGVRSQFSLARAVFGDNLLADVRIGPDGRLYQLGSSPETGIIIKRYSLGRTS
jgi:hypothetical protein